MAMQIVYLKEHERILRNPVGQLSSVSQAPPFWGSIGSQSTYGQSCGPLKSFPFENQTDGDQFKASKQGLDKGSANQFNIFSAVDIKSSEDGWKTLGAISTHSNLSEYRSCFELGFGQPMICTKYPYIDQYYGVLSTYGTQASGRVLLPLNLTSDDGPIYVNAKQYHGIMRRRKSRAKAVIENKVTKKRKPYMHHSRHLHAMRRPRGSGGRFLNTKKSNNEIFGLKMHRSGLQNLYHPTGSQNSEVLQSESGTMNSCKEPNGNGSNGNGSEVTSMYTRATIDGFPISHIRSSIHSLSGIMDSTRGIVNPSYWVAAADNNNNNNISCCNLKV